MTDYIKQLEAQNEELQSKLSLAEKILEQYSKSLNIEFDIIHYKISKKLKCMTLNLSPIGNYRQVDIFQIRRADRKGNWFFKRGMINGSLDIPESNDDKHYIDFILSFVDMEDIPYTIREIRYE